MKRFAFVLMSMVLLLTLFQDSSEPRLPPPPDALLDAVYGAYKLIAEGGSREEALGKIAKALETNEGSRYRAKAEQDIAHLKLTIEKARKLSYKPEDMQENPAGYLIETRFPLYFVKYRSNRGALAMEIKDPKHRDDPAAMLVKQGRKAIPDLIDLLDDCSLTRYHPMSGKGGLHYIPRVNDYAMTIIEHLTRCRFHFDASTSQHFSRKDPEDIAKTKEHVRKWWQENKDRPIIDGIKAQMPHADYYARIEMAQNAIDIGDREYGIFVLKDMIFKMEPRPAHIARILAERGDLSMLGTIFDRAKARNDCDSETAFYLTEIGGRQGWEFLHDVVKKKAEAKRKGAREIPNRYLLNSIMNVSLQDEARSLYLIPLLGVAVYSTENTGSRSLPTMKESHPFSPADVAAEKLQELTGQDFGYRPDETQKKRSAAIKKAQDWWEKAGSKKYTYDKIEEMIKETE